MTKSVKVDRRGLGSILLVVFGADAAVGAILAALPRMSPFVRVLVDGLTVTAIAVPLIWLIVGKPRMSAAQEAQEELQGRVAITSSERDRAEAGLRLFRAVLDRSNDAIEVIDPNTGRFLDVNDTACRAVGYTREEMLSLTVFDLTPALDRSQFDATRARLKNQQSMLIETSHRRKDGTTFPVELSLSHVDLGGEYNVAIVRDISARTLAAAELQLQSAALNSAGDPIVITDRAGVIAWVNAAFEATTGYSAAEAVGKNPRLLRSGVQDRDFYRGLWDTILAGTVWRGELVNRKKDGSLYPEMQTITPVRDRQGQISHFIAVKRDLTHEKLLQEQYLQAQKLESVGRLAGGVAHDFNNLLTVINGWAEVGRRELDVDGAAAKPFDEILNAGQRAATLTRQLLAMSRREMIAPSVFPVNNVVAETEKLLRRLLGEDISLEIRAAPTAGNVMMDRGQLGQVLMNLAVNARDAMPGGGKILIETAAVELGPEHAAVHGDATPGEYVMVAVRDSGTGMSKATMARVFEPFFTTKEAGKGTGLGLATTAGIVKQAGGHIAVESEEGVGTIMRVYLPKARHSEASAADPTPTPRPAGRETVLLVEDDAAVRKVTGRMLEALGYQVLTAASGPEALRIIERQQPPVDLLFTDVILAGGMNGREVAERAHVLKPELKVLYASGYTADITLLKNLLDQRVALLQKPFTSDALSGKIRAVLDDRGKGRIPSAIARC